MSVNRIITKLQLGYLHWRYGKEGWLVLLEKKIKLIRPASFQMGSGFVYNAYNLNGPAPNLLVWQEQLNRLKSLLNEPATSDVILNREVFPVRRYQVDVKDFFTSEGNYLNPVARVEMCVFLIKCLLEEYRQLQEPDEANAKRHREYNSHVLELYLKHCDDLVNGLLRFEP